jgi:hypothetical protein
VTADGDTLFSENRPAPQAKSVSAPPAQEALVSVPYTGAELWLHRVNVLIFVFLCASMGVLMFIVPWWPQWTDNHLLLGHPTLRSLVSSGFTRGLCSGLGVLDVWIGFSAAIHYREDKPA